MFGWDWRETLVEVLKYAASLGFYNVEDRVKQLRLNYAT
jgi:hypothetical protein